MVVGGWVVLGRVVAVVECTRLPVNSELALSYSVADQIEAHIHGFGASLFDSVICNSFGN